MRISEFGMRNELQDAFSICYSALRTPHSALGFYSLPQQFKDVHYLNNDPVCGFVWHRVQSEPVTRKA